MSLFEQILDHQGERSRELCTIARIKTHLTEDEAADLERALAERAGGGWRIEGTSIARALSKLLGERAYNIKGQTVQRHRNGGCSC